MNEKSVSISVYIENKTTKIRLSPCTENLNLSKKRVLFDKLQLVMHMNFLIIQENKVENLFMLLDELFLAF